MLEVASPNLRERTTLRLGGTAVLELVLQKISDLEELSKRLSELSLPYEILGRGSNILAMGGKLPLVLIRPDFRFCPQIVGKREQKTLVRCGAGIPLARLLSFCRQNALSGLEGLCGIPGTVGGAVAMNAGSFGSETCQALESIVIYNNCELREISADQLVSSYRCLKLKGINGKWIVVEATFGLTHDAKNGISRRMILNIHKKKSKQPVTAFTAGCVFKNPSAEFPAGKLLEMAGLKGMRIGGMSFSSQHANFMVNDGNGNEEEAVKLLDMAQMRVEEKFGFLLQKEVKIIPCCLP